MHEGLDELALGSPCSFWVLCRNSTGIPSAAINSATLPIKGKPDALAGFFTNVLWGWFMGMSHPKLLRLKLGRRCLSKDQDAPDEEAQFDDGRNDGDGIQIPGHESWDARQEEQPENEKHSTDIISFVHHGASTSTIL